MGCHIRKQQKAIILVPDVKNIEYIYQMKTQRPRKMLIYQWGEINLQSIVNSTIMRRRSTTQTNPSNS